MARPKTKQQLIDAATANFSLLWEQIDTLTDTQFTSDFDFANNPKLTEAHWQRDKNVRDILIHLYEWHQLLIRWITANQQNTSSKSIDFLPAPYNWKTYAQMNIKFWEQHQQTGYQQSVSLLNASHNQVMALIDSFNNDELFEKQYFSWTGTTSLGSYCISATSSHYDWAIKKIRKHKRNLS